MRVDLYDGYWIVEIGGIDYNIIGNKEDGYEVIFINEEAEQISYYSNKDFEACLVWCYNS